LLNLEYRGYDSVGFALIDSYGKLVVRKSKGKILDVEKKLGFDIYDGVAAIGHTRWATHGIPSDSNAHPHTDCYNKIAVVHNGIIHNYLEIREKLALKGHTLKSETDTEVVPHLLEDLLAEGYSMIESLRKLVEVIKGAYALAVLALHDKNRIYFAKNVSPLVIGLGKNSVFIASDIPAFLRYTNTVIVLEDGDFGYISPNDIYIENIRRGVVDWRKRIRTIDWTPDMVAKEGFPHFMLKEIHEQPIALRNTLASVSREIENATKIIVDAKRIFITGCGTSFHAAIAGEYMLNTIASLSTTSFVSSEYLRFRKVFKEGDVLIAISQSGETIDTLMAVREAKRRGARVVSISNVLFSAIPRESDVVIYTRAGPEIGVAATKTFTSQLLVLLLMSLHLAKILKTDSEIPLERISSEVVMLPKIAEDTILTLEPHIRKLAEKLKTKTNAFYLGRGIGVSISMEGALKLKEIAYIHAEAYPAGESKHGPIALVEEGFPVFFSVFDDEYKELIVSNIEEMNARKAFTVGLVPKGFNNIAEKLSVAFEMPRLTPYTASIVYVIPYQMIAYYTAVSKGLDPDKPRNLAKTVTVE